MKSDNFSRDLPLNALRVLDACARCLSFTKAAEELQVTQAAVSHQIKLLESYLEVRLFRRSGRGAALTSEGESYVGAVREALTHLQQATATLRAGRSAGVICSIATTIAMRWLMPRLGSFSVQYPDISLRLDITERFVDFSKETVDIAIRYGDGRWAGLAADLLFREVLIPVCSPKITKGKRLARPEDLKNHTLLHASASLADWDHWLGAHGMQGMDSSRDLIYEQPHLALKAAADGFGVAMADRALVQRELNTGALIAPFESGLAREQGYYVVGTPEARGRLDVGRFWRWLMAQAPDAVHEDLATFARHRTRTSRSAGREAGGRGDVA